MITIELTEDAVRNIGNMQSRIWAIENKYGADSAEADKARNSFVHVMGTIFRWPGHIYAEDELSLIINSSITIGVIWFAERLPDGERDPLLGSWSTHS